MWFDKNHLWSDVLLCNINFAPMFSIEVMFMGIYVSMPSTTATCLYRYSIVHSLQNYYCLGIWVY